MKGVIFFERDAAPLNQSLVHACQGPIPGVDVQSMTEFAQGLTLQPTRDGVPSSAVGEDVINPASLTSGRREKGSCR